MKPFADSHTVWHPARTLTAVFHKGERTIRLWCETGLLVQLGYRVRRDATGHWFVAAPPPSPPETGNSGLTP